ncbi:pilus biosynthesis protein [Streptosporangium jomthongense]|uniref:Pilus assembly protein n=1 Tax=Marinobacter aromaticivorans TaxID=1494078 RepID=A0ABW2IY96_9GAMM|nr:PilC/PilY family type IV pilus protein [Marinobacter aromaticivorans]GGE74055.1 pilus biosynthesis protein [Streptosporangium jomthongense]
MKAFNLKVMISAALLVLPTAGYSARPDFAQEPLFIGSAVAPNLMFILDDSGSMGWEYMPDEISGYNGIQSSQGDPYYQEGKDAYYPFYYSSRVNKIWYNPSYTYDPPLKADGTGSFPDSSYTSAPMNGYDSSSSTRDLRTKFSIRDYNVEGGGFYWEFNSSASCDVNPTLNSCYTYVSVNNLSASEQTNFANWYSYYNTRVKAARAGISEAFYNLPTSFRLGWGRINYGSHTVDGASGIRAVEEGVREYTSDRREDFLDWLYAAPSNGGTPLRRALEGAGKYYEKSKRAWADDPGKSVSDTNPVRECRLAYTILMSDGYYNGSDPSDSTIYQSDDKDGTEITNNRGYSFKYAASDPFKDGRGSYTLADVAMHYWKRDLRSDITNYVPTSEKNPAFWQHMSTYTVGLGVQGSVDPVAAFNAIKAGTYIDWWGGTSNENKVNDMLHAAVNGRGGFFSASDPEEFAKELAGTVGDIVAEAGSSTAVEFDVSSFQQGALIFSTQFDPNGWTGDLKAAKLGGTDSPVVPNFSDAIKNGDGWSARTILDNRDLSNDDRVIITYGNGAKGFRWTNLSSAQKDDLRYGSVGDTVAEQRLNYLRGDTSLDGTTGWRKRGSRLGSIVNSSPEFVGEPRAIWPDTAPFGSATKRFSDFASSKKSRTPVVYTGSNDGMLHGFKGTVNGGNEVLAYVPGFVYNSSASNAGLHFLTDPTYQHRYYVDLEIRQQDIFTKGKNANGTLTSNEDWRSIIVGGGRAGAKGIFALDITDPSQFTEANAEKIVLWEFSGSDNAHMGYVTQAPIIAMTKWGTETRWTAFVSNGYNSDTASTGFFMLDIEGGMDGTWDAADVRYVEFESGGAGLSPLAALDTTGDYLVDRVYAGDLDGNLWAAKLTSSGTWTTAYGTTSSPQPLFTTKANQAITAAPVAAANKTMPRAGNLPNLMVYFGTGKYLEASDVTSDESQSVYGVWDRGTSGLSRSNLESRSITEGSLTLPDTTTAKVRYSTGNKMDYTTAKGWYVDLPTDGERAVLSAQVRGEFLYLNTMIPDQNPCLGGGTGWLMALGLDGLTPEKRAFLKFGAKVAGYQSSGLPNQSTFLGNFRFTPGSDNKDPTDVVEVPPLSGAVVNAGRRGWNELINE